MNNFYRKHYTIIEMLVVISILGVLIAMGAPAAIRMMSKQKSTVAKQEIGAIKQAVKAYEAEYGKLPLVGTSIEILNGTSNPTAMAFLQELMAVTTTENTRNIKFLTWIDRYNASTTAVKGIGVSDDLVADNWIDPWGNPYVVMIDYDYNGLIENIAGDGGIDLDGSGSANTKLRGSVFVFSSGEDGINGMDTFSGDVLTKFIDEEYDSNEDGDAGTNEKGSTNSDNVKSW